MSATRPAGRLNLIEIGVVILIILVLISLLLPAVQQAREAARRTQWRNNLKQLGLALHNYHDNFSVFPPGGTFAADGTPHHSWTAVLIPYLEATPWFNQLNLDLPWDDARQIEHFMVFRNGYSLYGDPSIAGSIVRLDGLSNVHCAANSWLLHRNSSISLRKVTTGTSNTLFVSDAFSHYFPFGHPTIWRDVTAGMNRSPDEFGHATRPVVHVLLVDGSVRVMDPKVDEDVFKTLAGPEELRPQKASVARLPWPYVMPPGGYWKKEILGFTGGDRWDALYVFLRRDPADQVREAKSEAVGKGGFQDSLENLEQGPIDDLVMKLRNYPTLQRVDLDHVSDAAIEALHDLQELNTVQLGGPRITDRSLTHLARFPALRELELSATSVTDEGLKSPQGFHRLQRLTIHLNEIANFTAQGILSFMKAHPQVKVVVYSSGRWGGYGWATHDWSRAELEVLAAHNLTFGDPQKMGELMNGPIDAQFPLNILNGVGR